MAASDAVDGGVEAVGRTAEVRAAACGAGDRAGPSRDVDPGPARAASAAGPGTKTDSFYLADNFKYWFCI